MRSYVFIGFNSTLFPLKQGDRVFVVGEQKDDVTVSNKLLDEYYGNSAGVSLRILKACCGEFVDFELYTSPLYQALL